MGLIDWAEEKIHKLTIWDWSLAKLALIVFGMVIGAYIPVFVKQYVWYFVGVFVVAYTILLYRIFKK